jgi:hypothetical protein
VRGSIDVEAYNNSFFETKGESFRHPLLTFLDKAPREIEVARPTDVLGYKAAKIYLHLTI